MIDNRLVTQFRFIGDHQADFLPLLQALGVVFDPVINPC